jgi:hypothetical protein
MSKQLVTHQLSVILRDINGNYRVIQIQLLEVEKEVMMAVPVVAERKVGAEVAAAELGFGVVNRGPTVAGHRGCQGGGDGLTGGAARRQWVGPEGW